MSQITYPFQAAIEDFIKTAESLGHRGTAKLSSQHPAIKVRQWGQIRKDYGILASYRDELGNLVELAHSGTMTFLRNRDPRQTFYGRLLGTCDGFAVKAESRAEAREILAAKLVIATDSDYLLIATKAALGVSYSHT